MKRLLFGGLAVGSLLFAATGVASANTTTPQAPPAVIGLDSTVVTSLVSGGAWPLATDPGSMTVSFATPAPSQAISGYAVTCKAPVVDTLGNPIVLPNLVATFVVNPADGSSADTDYSNDGTTTTLLVGPYSVNEAASSNALAHALPPLACTVVPSNAGGAAKAGKPNKATAPAPSGDCSPNGTGTIPGLETRFGGGNIDLITSAFPGFFGSNNTPPTAPTVPGIGVGKQTGARNNDVVIADLSGVGGPSAVPFCTTNSTYNPHLLSDQAVTFSPTVAQIPAKTVGTGLHPAQAKLSGLNIVASVKSTSTLTVAAGASVLFAYDAAHFHIDACPSTAAVTCITDTAAIIAGSGGTVPAITGVGYIAAIDSNSHTVLPGKPIVSSAISLTISKNVYTQVAAGSPCDKWTGPASGFCVLTTSVAGPYPAAFGLSFGGAKTTISVGAAPGVPVQVAPPAGVIAKVNASFVSVGVPACASSTTGPATATCLPYSTLAGIQGFPAHSNPYTGGDTNQGSAIALVYSSLF